jgi:arylsulfatase
LCDVAVAFESRPEDLDWDLVLGSDQRRADWVACTIGLAHQLLGATIDGTPVAARSARLPKWLVPSVLAGWGRQCAADYQGRSCRRRVDRDAGRDRCAVLAEPGARRCTCNGGSATTRACRSRSSTRSRASPGSASGGCSASALTSTTSDRRSDGGEVPNGNRSRGGGSAARGRAARTLAGARRSGDVLLITIDTLRADHLHCYGQALETSPNIDALAARGVLFERAIAASGYTGPSHSSMMTGLYPRRHSMGFANGMLVLSGGETLAETFQRHGYDTAAFVSNAVLWARSGLNRGFAVYDDEFTGTEANRPGTYERRAAQTLERARLAARRAPSRFSSGCTSGSARSLHGATVWRSVPLPVGADEPELRVLDDDSGRGGIPRYQVVDGERRVSEYRSRYADEIAYMDHSVGELLAAVERYSPTVIAFTGDHGESFGERGVYFAHGHSAAPDLSHVPFILAAPGLRPERRADPVSHVDLMPTLLELAGAAGGECRGSRSGSLLRTGAAIPPRAVFCDIGYEVGTYAAHEFQLSATPEEKTWALQAFDRRGRARRAASRGPRSADRLRDLSMGRRPDLDRARSRAGVG